MRKQNILILIILCLNCENSEKPDTIRPIINLSSPSDGSTVYEITPIKANVSDNEGIDRVEFYIGAQLVDTISDEPFTHYWNTTTINNGSIRTIQCRAYDTSDNEAISPSINVTINNEGRNPIPVSLSYQTYRDKYNVDLTWTASTDIDFNKYLIQRADSVTSNSIWDCIESTDWPDYNFDENCVITWSTIDTVSFITDTTYSDMSATISNYYVYNIAVLDSANLSSESNLRYFYTRNVESLPITNLIVNNELSVDVEWQQSNEDDFFKYELFKYEENDTLLIFTTYNVSENSYVDENSTEFVSYSYYIRHYDTSLNFTDGNAESISVHLSPATLEVPSEFFSTIQSALNAAEPTDIVLVNDGTYYENLIFPKKNNVKMRSLNGPELTIIDGSRNGAVITVRGFNSVMDTTTSIEGFTIQNAGYIDNSTEPYVLWDGDGSGINLEYNANILLKNNIIRDNYNSCGGGGGIYSYNSSPIIVNNLFIENTAGISPNGEYCGNWYGGGIMAYFGSPQIINCAFIQNKAQHEGGAIRIYETENTEILNCVFFDNQLIGEWDRGSIIEVYGDLMVLEIMNCIFWNSNSNPIDSYYTSPTINISYSLSDFSDSDANYFEGNINNNNPDFIDEIEFRLNNISPCIDSGHPNSQYNDADGSRNDMGIYGGSFGIW
jgi:hypothetical protein